MIPCWKLAQNPNNESHWYYADVVCPDCYSHTRLSRRTKPGSGYGLPETLVSLRLTCCGYDTGYLYDPENAPIVQRW